MMSAKYFEYYTIILRGAVFFVDTLYILLRSYFYRCVWSVITAHNLTPEKRDNNLFAPAPNPHFVPPKQHLTYNWHLALLWVSVMHTWTRSSITV